MFGNPDIIYTIIRHKSVDVRKRQVAILARSPREMSETDRILPRYILSRVRVSVRPRIVNPFTWVAQRQELSAKDVVAECSDQGSNPVQGTIFFHFYCLRLTRLTFTKS